jgi:hypothetical protein
MSNMRPHYAQGGHRVGSGRYLVEQTDSDDPSDLVSDLEPLLTELEIACHAERFDEANRYCKAIDALAGRLATVKDDWISTRARDALAHVAHLRGKFPLWNRA